MKNNTNASHAGWIFLPMFLLGISACSKDVSYEFDIPESDADCPNGMTFRSGGSAIVDRSGGSVTVDRSGGSTIVERSGGSVIKDRNGSTVTSYCEESTCEEGNWSDDPPEIDWHTDSDYLVANRLCLASEQETAGD